MDGCSTPASLRGVHATFRSPIPNIDHISKEVLHLLPLSSRAKREASGSCRASGTILPWFFRATGSGRRKARSPSVSESCQRSRCGLRKSVSRRRAFFTSASCCDPCARRMEDRESVVAWYSTDDGFPHRPTRRPLLRQAHFPQRNASS
jgi:hypothetical protein